MTTHYTDSDVDAARAALRVHVGPDDAHMIDDPECAEDVRVVLDAVAPAITRRAKAEALRDMAFDLEHFETFPGEEPQRLRDRADEIEAGQ